MVRDGAIDTLIVAITDMQDRLMGKRVQAQAFLDGVIEHGRTSARTARYEQQVYDPVVHNWDRERYLERG